jgi:hypothetical protein
MLPYKSLALIGITVAALSATNALAQTRAMVAEEALGPPEKSVSMHDESKLRQWHHQLRQYKEKRMPLCAQRLTSSASMNAQALSRWSVGREKFGTTPGIPHSGYSTWTVRYQIVGDKQVDHQRNLQKAGLYTQPSESLCSTTSSF